MFQYRSARRFLVDSIETRKKLDRSFSIRKWSKEIGLRSHTLLVMVLQGKRALTLKQAPYLAQGLRLSTPEKLYFQCLIQYENARTDEERSLCRLWMSEINPGADTQIREVDEFLMISHWVHMAILSATDLKSPATLSSLTERLSGRIHPDEVRAAVERLLSLGLLKKEGDRFLATYTRVTTRDDVANKGAREYHKQVSSLAAEAVERIPVERREFQSFALSMPLSKISLAKEMIRKFRTQLCEAVKGEPGDEVFQVNLQLFQLTESPSEMVPKVDAGTEREIERPRKTLAIEGHV